ncbi:lipopolysaccharide biosynthesis protein [Lachnospiraceae bacterium C1.1]
MNREKELIKNTFILSIGTFLPKLTTIITLPILSRCLTKEEYGIYDLINTLVFLIMPLITIKLEMATFRFLIDHRNDRKESSRIISCSLSLVGPISLIASGIIFIILKTIGFSAELCTV